MVDGDERLCSEMEKTPGGWKPLIMGKDLLKPSVGSVPASARQVGGTYYKDSGVQPWDVVDTWPIEQRIGYYRGNALKYLMRMGSKDEQKQEVGKGIHYLEKLLEVLKEGGN